MKPSIDHIISKYYWWAFFVLLAIALTTHLDYLPLKFEEPRRGIVAMEMELSGNYIAPTINGEYYYNKPPVYNWFLLIIFKIFGSHEDWILRLPTVLSFLVIPLINFFFVKRILGMNVAILSSLFFITSTDLLFYFSFQGEIDMFYCLIVYLQLISTIWFFEKKQYYRLFLISYLLAAIGVLTKGLPSIAFQAITILILFISERRFKELFHLANFLGLGLFLLTISGYFLLYQNYNDPLLFIGRLFTESTNRTVLENSFFDSIKHLFTFPLVLIDVLSPWLLIAPLFASKSIFRSLKENKWLRYISLVIAANMFLYWISPGVRDRYLYMFIPLVGVLFAFTVVEHFKNNNKLPKAAFYLILVLFLILTIAMPILPFIEPISEVKGILLICLLSSLAFAFLTYLFFKSSTQKLFLFILFVVTVRISFNFIIMPFRLQDELKDNFKHHVANMIDIVDENEFYFYGQKEKSLRNLPILNTELEYNDLNYHPYQLTYYVEKSRGEIFNFKDSKVENAYYLADKKYLDLTENEINVLYEFHLNLRNYDFVLFQFK